MDRRALWPMVHGVTKSQTQLSYKHFHFGSWGLGSHEGEWCPYKKRLQSLTFLQRSPQQVSKEGDLWTNGPGLSKHFICQHLDFVLLITSQPQEPGRISLSFITYSVYGILLYPPKQTKMYISPRCIDKCYQFTFACAYICLPLHSVNKPYMSRNNT